VYAGVGVGIASAGLLCLAASVRSIPPDQLWLLLALLSVALGVPVALVLRRLPAIPAAHGGEAGGSGPVPRGTAPLILCYGIMGYGYILPATFLPFLASKVVTDPAVFGWAWPIFGLTAAVSTWAAGKAMRLLTRLQVWSVCQLLMGIGAVLPSLWPYGLAIVLSAVLVGGTFMVITLMGVQEIRGRVNWDAGKWVGYLTAAFALGQIAGPVASLLFLQDERSAQRALDMSLQSAAMLLLISAGWLWREANVSTHKKEMQSAQ